MQTFSAVSSVSELLEMGNYWFVHDFITNRNFPDARNHFVSPQAMRVIVIDREMPTDWVCKLIRKKGLYPATIYQLLYFGAMNPQMRVTTPINALGTIIDYIEEPFPPTMKKPHCAGIHDMSQRRGINLVSVEGKWGRGCGFLAYSV